MAVRAPPPGPLRQGVVPLTGYPPSSQGFLSPPWARTWDHELRYPFEVVPTTNWATRFDIRHYLGRPFSSFLYSYHLWYMSTCYLCLSSRRKSIYSTRNAMPRKTCRFRLSQKIMKFYVLTRFRETIPTVQSVLSSEI